MYHPCLHLAPFLQFLWNNKNNKKYDDSTKQKKDHDSFNKNKKTTHMYDKVNDNGCKVIIDNSVINTTDESTDDEDEHDHDSEETMYVYYDSFEEIFELCYDCNSNNYDKESPNS